MKETKNKILLIDADMVLYRSVCAAEQEMRWDDDIWTLQTNMSEAKAEVDNQLSTITKRLKSDDILLLFSPKRTFRHDLLPAYKANRSSKRKPLGISELKEWMMNEYPSEMFPNIEADDAIGILATEDPDNRVAVSADKDFGTLPITWYNHQKDVLRIVSSEEANHFHLMQSLMGDSTDGFTGLRGCGPRTAEKLLEKNGATWGTVVDAYKAKGQTAEDALLTARLARILRHGDYNKETNEVKLWQPES
jgi:DNA polymerase-1